MAHQAPGCSRTLLMLPVAATLAWASSPQAAIPPHPHPWGWSFGAHQPGNRGHESHPSTAHSPASSHRTHGYTPDACGAWRFGVQPCHLPAIHAPRPQPTRARVSPRQLASTAWRRLALPRPQLRTAPPRSSDGLVGLVGLPEWFWVTNWSPHTRTARAGSIWARVTAHPRRLVIHPGASQTSVDCLGPGSAYDARRSAAAQRSNCTYTYSRSSAGLPADAYTVTATVVWGGTWRGAGGAGGSLPAVERSTTLRLRIAEGQALTTGG